MAAGAEEEGAAAALRQPLLTRTPADSTPDAADDSDHGPAAAAVADVGMGKVLLDFMNVFKAFIGSNYLSVPFAFSQAGYVLGSILLVIIAAITVGIVATKKQCSPEEEEHIARSFQYGHIGELLYGQTGLWIVNGLLAFTQFSFCVGYFIFLGNTFTDLVNSRHLPPELSILVLAVVVLPCCFLRDVRAMSPISMFANVALFGGFLAVLTDDLRNFKVDKTVVQFRWSEAAIFFGSVTSSFEGIGTIIPIESSMTGNRQRYPFLLRCAICGVAVILGSFGIVGYLKYGADVDQIIIGELAFTSVLARCVRVGLLVGITFTYPLQLFPVVQLVESVMFGTAESPIAGISTSTPADTTKVAEEGDDSTKPLIVNERGDVRLPSGSFRAALVQRLGKRTVGNIIRVTLVLASCGLGIAFRHDFGYFSSIVGSIGGAALAFILPCFFHNKLFGDRLSRATVVKNYAILVFGVVGAAAGLYASIRAMIH